MQTELRKKAVHILMGVSFVVLLEKDLVNIWLFLFALGVCLLLIWARKYKKWDNIMKRFDRKDKKGGIGAFWFVLGVLLVWLVFHNYPKLVAASVMILTFGDTASSIFGRRFGDTPNPLDHRKNLEGMMTGILFAFLGAAFFVPWPAAVVGSAAAMIVEAADFRYKIYAVDDNLVMPLLAAVAMFPLL